MRSLLLSFLVFVGSVTARAATDESTYLLAPELAKGETSAVKVTLEVGGETYLKDDPDHPKLPLTVAAEFRYLEKLLASEGDATQPTRSLRRYDVASAKIQKGEGGHVGDLTAPDRLLVAECRDGRSGFAGVDTPLTRDELDLVNVVGNSLVLNRLLPGSEKAEGDSWKHDAATIGALLDMDNVAVCEVSSMVIGCVNQQVQIRLAGTVHGSKDGAPTEMQLRAAYLFHEQRKQITKFNLAIKQTQTASQLVPGLDIVAKVSVTVAPTKSTLESKDFGALADLSEPLPNDLSYAAPERGYRFLHDSAWYVIAEQSDRVSLRSLHSGNVTAHCSLSTLPARSAGRETTLEEFERDVREALGENLASISAATNWTTRQGHDCLGIVARGETEGIAIEWRYYLLSSPNLPRVSLSVTIEQSQLEAFSDADRQIVETLELVKKTTTTASKSTSKQAR